MLKLPKIDGTQSGAASVAPASASKGRFFGSAFGQFWAIYEADPETRRRPFGLRLVGRRLIISSSYHDRGCQRDNGYCGDDREQDEPRSIVDKRAPGI
jgi:hypothetical protein